VWRWLLDNEQSSDKVASFELTQGPLKPTGVKTISTTMNQEVKNKKGRKPGLIGEPINNSHQSF
jgi:hypothetical protein